MRKQIKRHKAMKKLRLRVMFVILLCAAGMVVGMHLTELAENVSKEQKLPFVTSGMTAKEQGRCYYYGLLSEEEQSAYREILGGIRAGRDEIYVHLSNPDRCNTVFQYVYMDYPEFFWCDGSSRTTSYTLPDAYSVLTPGYTVSGENRSERKAQIEMAAEEWLGEIPAELSEYEKIQKVYEMMIDRVEYDENASDNQNIYSVFVNHQSVCAGYARATQYLLDRLGIFCMYVTGTVYTGEAHAWNIVKCGGEYYHVDTTWGDPVFLQEENEAEIAGDEVTYDYLCCPDAELFKTHTLTQGICYPKCSASEYEYYRRNGMYYESADAGGLERVLQKAIEEKQEKVIFKFRDDEVYQEACGILFGGLLERQAQYLGRWYALNQIHYYYREEAKADKITIYWKYE